MPENWDVPQINMKNTDLPDDFSIPNGISEDYTKYLRGIYPQTSNEPEKKTKLELQRSF